MEQGPDEVLEVEQRYEVVELIVKARSDGQTWFDVLFDYIAQDCEGSETEPCTCGMEHMSGSGGTLEQCWRHLDIADDLVTVQVADLERVLDICRPLTEEQGGAVRRLRTEITWWDDLLASPVDEEEWEDEAWEGDNVAMKDEDETP